MEWTSLHSFTFDSGRSGLYVQSPIRSASVFSLFDDRRDTFLNYMNMPPLTCSTCPVM